MNNPVQIVLNSKNFINNITPTGGGGNTDFFLGRDSEFIAHKESLDFSVSKIIEKAKSNNENLIYTNISLQERGWAKSHRPVKKLFNEDNIISIRGGNNLGEIIIGLTIENLENIRNLILEAPDENELERKDGVLKPKVKTLRSEVSVIHDIRVYDQVDKRKFSTNQAIEWLKDSKTGHSYYIETFIDYNNQSSKEKESLTKSLNSIKEIYPNIKISFLAESWLHSIFVIIKFNDLNDLNDLKKHEELLKTLDSSPTIRSIYLPPILQTTQKTKTTTTQTIFPIPIENKSYPVVGIIDTGVSESCAIKNWSVGGVDFLDKTVQDLSHGTFIGGLISGAKYLNSQSLLDENECKFFDLDMFPTTGDFDDYYPTGFLDLLKQLDDFIPMAKEHGVRVFNMSLNLLNHVDDNSYSIFANIIDNISKKHDVIFVISAGNLHQSIIRNEWPEDDNKTLKMLAEYSYQGQDRIYQPSESVYSICVGAIDPETTSKSLTPSQYTRRGPGVSFGQKPDVVHIGGAYNYPHNLTSIDPNGNLTQGCGTSYAAPLVAKILANLDFAISDSSTTETLKALLIHHSNKPEWSNSKRMKKTGDDFVGFGIPSNASSSLINSDHEITMVFASEITKNQELVFEFSWPKSLTTTEGGIKGQINITLVYSPEINRLNGSEFLLQTLDVWLRQQTKNINETTGEPIFSNILKTSQSYSSQNEKSRITHGSKWWPTRNIQQKFRGKGESSLCRLIVEPLARSGFEIITPIPFTVIMTISDPNSKNDIFNEVRSQLNATGVSIADIRSNIQSRLRP